VFSWIFFKLCFCPSQFPRWLFSPFASVLPPLKLGYASKTTSLFCIPPLPATVFFRNPSAFQIASPHCSSPSAPELIKDQHPSPPSSSFTTTTPSPNFLSYFSSPPLFLSRLISPHSLFLAPGIHLLSFHIRPPLASPSQQNILADINVASPFVESGCFPSCKSFQW